MLVSTLLFVCSFLWFEVKWIYLISMPPNMSYSICIPLISTCSLVCPSIGMASFMTPFIVLWKRSIKTKNHLKKEVIVVVEEQVYSISKIPVFVRLRASDERMCHYDYNHRPNYCWIDRYNFLFSIYFSLWIKTLPNSSTVYIYFVIRSREWNFTAKNLKFCDATKRLAQNLILFWSQNA